MRAVLSAGLALVLTIAAVEARQIDYAVLWAGATPFHTFLESVRSRQDEWRTRFSNAAVDPAALTAAKALPARRRILAIAEDRCSDSAWAVPYLAKLAAAAPEKLELRVIGRAKGRPIQAAHPTPDGRLATPTIVILDENDAFIGAWVERPAELQTWFIDKKPSLSSDERHAQMAKWYGDDGGRTTLREVVAILGHVPSERK